MSPKYPSSAIFLTMGVGISAALLSSSLATGMTSRSAKSRTLSRIWTCSSLSAPPLGLGMGISLASVGGALLHQDLALVDADFLAALVHPGGAHVDDAAVWLAPALALVQHLGRGDQRVSRVDPFRELHVPV